jgi:hypothetical protein
MRLRDRVGIQATRPVLLVYHLPSKKIIRDDTSFDRGRLRSTTTVKLRAAEVKTIGLMQSAAGRIAECTWTSSILTYW